MKDLEIFDITMKLNSSDPNIIAKKAMSIFKLNKIKESKALNEIALHIDPTNVQSIFNKVL